MKSHRFCMTSVLSLVMLASLGFAGIEWEAKITHTIKDKVATDIHHLYAQAGMVREEFTQIEGKAGLMKKGAWWLYKAESNTITIVDPTEKTYIEMSMDSMLSLLGAVGQIIKMKISNATTELEELSPESVGTYLCRHVSVNSAYDMEMKIVMMKMSSHIELKKEMWTTNAIPIEDVSLSYSLKSVKTGISDLDALIDKDLETYKNLGFIVKSITTTTTTTKGKSETSTSEMSVSGLTVKDLSADLFKVPEDYKKIEFNLKLGGEE